MTTSNTQGAALLETWLGRATRHLSAESTAQVRGEIQDHYQSAREEALADGAAPEQADRIAVTALGDANDAGREYRKVMLTRCEAALLRETRWEARAVCQHRSLLRHRSLLSIPAATLCAGIWFFAAGDAYLGAVLTLMAAGLGLLFASPLLPIHTPARARIFRAVRWAWMAAILIIAAWPGILKQSWFVAACAWPLVWVEWTMFSLRRKLPATAWPRQLYL